MELIDREKIEWYGCNFETPRCESENRKCCECFHAECSHEQVMQLPSIKVPSNPTNGEVMMAVFKEVQHYSDGKICADWWNAKYKGGGGEE